MILIISVLFAVYFRVNDTSIFDELTFRDPDLVGDVDIGADITGRM